MVSQVEEGTLPLQPPAGVPTHVEEARAVKGTRPMCKPPSSSRLGCSNHPLRRDSCDGAQLRRSRSLLTTSYRSQNVMSLSVTGGPNSTPFAANDYTKRLEHVSIHHILHLHPQEHG